MYFSVFNSLLIESKLILLLFLSGIISNLESFLGQPVYFLNDRSDFCPSVFWNYPSFPSSVKNCHQQLSNTLS